MPARKNSKSSPRSIKMHQRIKEALEYRREGFSYEEIAEFMREDHPGEKIYKQKVASWVLRGMREIIEEPALENLKLDLERLDAMFSAAYKNALNGDIQSIGAAVGILDRRAKIFGYDSVKGLGDEQAQRPVHITFVDKRSKRRLAAQAAADAADDEANPPKDQAA